MSYQNNLYSPANFSGFAFVQGFRPESFTSTTAVFGPGSVRGFANDLIIEYTGFGNNLPSQITINAAIVGPNGCFPNALSAVTPAGGLALVPVYAVGNSGGTSGGSLSNSAGVVAALVIGTAATGFIPAGYDTARIVGYVVVNSSGALVPYAMSGNYNSRSLMLQDAALILSAGAATTATKVDLILGASGGALPFQAIGNVNILYSFTPNSAADIASLIPHGLTSASKAPVEIKTNGTVIVTGNVSMPAGNDAGTAAIDYLVTSASDSLSLWVSGFDISIPFAA